MVIKLANSIELNFFIHLKLENKKWQCMSVACPDLVGSVNVCSCLTEWCDVGVMSRFHLFFGPSCRQPFPLPVSVCHVTTEWFCLCLSLVGCTAKGRERMKGRKGKREVSYIQKCCLASCSSFYLAILEKRGSCRLPWEYSYVILHIFSVCYAYKGQRNPTYRSRYQLQRSWQSRACLLFLVWFPATAYTPLMYYNINHTQYS